MQSTKLILQKDPNPVTHIRCIFLPHTTWKASFPARKMDIERWWNLCCTNLVVSPEADPGFVAPERYKFGGLLYVKESRIIDTKLSTVT